MKTIVCLHPSGCSRLGLLESSGGRRRTLPSLTTTGHAQKGEVYGVQRRAIKGEAREEPAAFTEECLRRIGNRHVRSLRSDGKSGLCGDCSHQDCWAESTILEEKTHLSKDAVGGEKNFFTRHSNVIFSYPSTVNFSTYSSRVLLL